MANKCAVVNLAWIYVLFERTVGGVGSRVVGRRLVWEADASRRVRRWGKSRVAKPVRIHRQTSRTVGDAGKPAMRQSVAWAGFVFVERVRPDVQGVAWICDLRESIVEGVGWLVRTVKCARAVRVLRHVQRRRRCCAWGCVWISCAMPATAEDAESCVQSIKSVWGERVFVRRGWCVVETVVWT